MKKQFNIPFLSFATGSLNIEGVSSALNKLERQLITHVPWSAFNYKPITEFSIAHDGSNILLKYFVQENAVLARCRETNGPVFKDSCVEFFIDFNDQAGYYNIEFNCAGTGHIGFGQQKESRKQVPNHIVENITHQVLFKTSHTSDNDYIQWELSLVIPLKAFYFHNFQSFTNRLCRINVYKCGDDLPTPHYLAWKNISSSEPDFHQPEFFEVARFSNPV